jgi:hypothetical protein
MIRKLSSLAAVALIATVPSVASADGLAVSLSASFGNSGSGTVVVLPNGGAGGTINTPTSVSVAGAAGGFAVASSVATAASSGAAAGATDNEDLTPLAEVFYNDDANAYETTVSFAPSPNLVQAAADAAAAQICAGLSGTLDDLTGTVPPGVTTTVNLPTDVDVSLNGVIVTFSDVDFNGSLDDNTVTLNGNAVSIDCAL